VRFLGSTDWLAAGRGRLCAGTAISGLTGGVGCAGPLFQRNLIRLGPLFELTAYDKIPRLAPELRWWFASKELRSATEDDLSSWRRTDPASNEHKTLSETLLSDCLHRRLNWWHERSLRCQPI
jgi:hypothetical protein